MSNNVTFECQQCAKITINTTKGIHITMQLANGKYIASCDSCGTVLTSDNKYPVDVAMYRNYKENKHLIDDLLYPEVAIEREKKSREVALKRVTDYADSLDW